MASGKQPLWKNRVRLCWIAMLAAALPILVADDLFGSYVRVYWRHRLSGELAALPSPLGVPLPWLVGSLGLMSIAALIWGAGWLLESLKAGERGRRRAERIFILTSLAASVGLVLVYLFSSVWASASQSIVVPQEASGLAALAAVAVLLAGLFFRSWRSLAVAQVTVLLALFAAVFLPRLRADHRVEVAAIRSLLDRAEADLSHRRTQWEQVDPSRIETASRRRGEQAGVFRFDERLSDVVALEAAAKPGAVASSVERGAALRGAPFQAGYERVGGEIRRVLMTSAPSTATWLVPVPAARPRMRFGLAAADPGVPVTFEVLAGTGEEARAISAQRIAGAGLWQDFELDLSPWAGEETRISLRTTSPEPSLGLWSNPVVFGERAALPNVVVYLVDCLRAQNLGAHGYGRPTSAVFDGLAAHGTLFENAYSNGTTTKHSIPSLFTSNPISATRVRYMPDVLPAEFPTIAEILRWSGYTTAAFAANSTVGPFSGTHQGFSRVYSAARMAGAAGQPLDSEDIEIIVAPLLEEWMAENRDRNFLLYVHTLDPHGVYDPPPPYRTFFEALRGGSPVPWNPIFDPQWLAAPTAESRQALYDGELVYGDEHFGRFLSMLRQVSERQRTVFVFTADHGEYFGEHGMYGHTPPAFVQGVHVPLFVMGPGIPEGKRVAEPVQLMDVLPTILDAVGLEPGDPLFQGRSLLPLARGDQKDEFGARAVFIEGSRPDHVSVRLGPFHFINEKNLWFDLREDPLETRPWSSLSLELGLKTRARRLARRYREVYWELHDRVVREGPAAHAVDAETLRQLRALGYLD